MFEYHLHLTCACGHQITISAEDVPTSWQADRYNIKREVIARLKCSCCGRKGRPQSVTILPQRTAPTMR